MTIDIRYYILDANNNVVDVGDDVMTWGRWFEHADNRIVGYTEITSECCVSTVFLGLDHRFFDDGPPLIFETIIFGGPLDEEQWRYSSYNDAETGHKAAVRKAREAIGQKMK
jgi:hypothetical protein